MSEYQSLDDEVVENNNHQIIEDQHNANENNIILDNNEFENHDIEENENDIDFIDNDDIEDNEYSKSNDNKVNQIKENRLLPKNNEKKDLKFDTSKYIKSIIYGGMDGLVSIFVSIAVAASGQAKITVLLVIVLSKLIAGAISMGMGDYLGTQADVDFAIGERKREAWEVEYYIEGEKKEMVDIYLSKGLPIEVATEVVDILAKNPKGFVDIMMVEELGIMPDVESEVAWKNGLVNFVSFLIFGIIPLIPYLVFLAIASIAGLPTQENLGTFISVVGLTIITLFLMGVFKAKMTDTTWWKNGITTVVFGCIGAAVGYVTVLIIQKIFPQVNF